MVLNKDFQSHTVSGAGDETAVFTRKSRRQLRPIHYLLRHCVFCRHATASDYAIL